MPKHRLKVFIVFYSAGASAFGSPVPSKSGSSFPGMPIWNMVPYRIFKENGTGFPKRLEIFFPFRTGIGTAKRCFCLPSSLLWTLSFQAAQSR